MNEPLIKKNKIIYSLSPLNNFGKLRWVWCVISYLLINIFLMSLYNRESQFFETISHYALIYSLLTLIFFFLSLLILEKNTLINSSEIILFYNLFGRRILTLTYPIKNFPHLYISKNKNYSFIAFFPKKILNRFFLIFIPFERIRSVEKDLFLDNPSLVKSKFFILNLENNKKIEIKSTLTLGKKTTSSFFNNNQYLSNFHCKLMTSDNEVYIQDENSKNGTFLNSKKIPLKIKTKIKERDIIEIGGNKTTILFQEEKIEFHPVTRKKFLFLYFFRPIYIPLFGFILILFYPFDVPQCSFEHPAICFHEGKKLQRRGDYQSSSKKFKVLCDEEFTPKIIRQNSCLLEAINQYALNKPFYFHQYLSKGSRLNHHLSTFYHSLFFKKKDSFKLPFYEVSGLCESGIKEKCLALSILFTELEEEALAISFFKKSLKEEGQNIFDNLTHPLLQNLYSKTSFQLYSKDMTKKLSYFNSNSEQNAKIAKNYSEAKSIVSFHQLAYKKTCLGKNINNCFELLKKNITEEENNLSALTILDINSYLSPFLEEIKKNKEWGEIESNLSSYELNILLLDLLLRKKINSPKELITILEKTYHLKKQTILLEKKIKKSIYQLEEKGQFGGSINESYLSLLNKRFHRIKKESDLFTEITFSESFIFQISRFPFIKLLYSKIIQWNSHFN